MRNSPRQPSPNLPVQVQVPKACAPSSAVKAQLPLPIRESPARLSCSDMGQLIAPTSSGTASMFVNKGPPKVPMITTDSEPVCTKCPSPAQSENAFFGVGGADSAGAASDVVHGPCPSTMKVEANKIDTSRIAVSIAVSFA